MYAPEVMIRMERVTRYFGLRRALHEVSLAVQAGEKIVVVGPTGSGKSTLLRAIKGLEGIDAGRILVDGCDVADKHSHITKIRPEVGMVFPAANLFPHKRVLENLTLAPMKLRGVPRAEAERDGLKLLARVGLQDKARAWPAQLSGGEQQRVAIARALAMHPKVMLFDEPTESLRPEMIREVLEVMAGIAEEATTMVVVTHEVGFSRKVADRLVFMDQGEIIETGPPESLLDNSSHPRTRCFLAQILRASSYAFAAGVV